MKKDKSIYWQIFSIAIPVMLQHVILSSNSLLDNWMIKSLGTEAVAAIGSALRFYMVFRITMFGITSAANVLSSQFFAKNDMTGLRRSIGANITANLVTSFVFVFVYFGNKVSILQSFSADPTVQRLAAQYLDIVILNTPIMAIVFALVSAMRNSGKVTTPLMVSIIAIFINLTFNYLLIFGHYGFPKWGIQGAAIATILSEILSLAALIYIAYTFKYEMAGSLKEFTDLSKEFWKKYGNIAIPITVSNFLWSLGSLFYHNLFGKLGTDALAAYGVMTPFEISIQNLFSGFAYAAIIIVGGQIGLNNFDKAYKNAKIVAISGAMSAAAFGAAIALFSGPISMIYTGMSPISVSYVQKMLLIYGLFQGIRTFNLISYVGILKSGGDSVFLLTVSVITTWAFGVPLVYIGHYWFNWDPISIYLAINSLELVASIIWMQRIRSKKWMKNLTIN